MSDYYPNPNSPEENNPVNAGDQPQSFVNQPEQPQTYANPSSDSYQGFSNSSYQDPYGYQQNQAQTSYGYQQAGQQTGYQQQTTYTQGNYQQNYQQTQNYGSSANKNPYSQGYNPYNAAYLQGSQPAEKTKQKTGKGVAVRVICLILVCAIVFGSLGYGINAILHRSKTSAPTDTASSMLPSESQASGFQNQTENASSDATDTYTARNEAFANSSLALTFSDNSESSMSIPDVVKKTADSVVEITTEYVTTSYSLQQYISSGAGSGVIVTSDGYIITNNHVIENATNITVTLRNGESYPAKLVGLDEDLDIALLKIEAINLTVATIGSSGDLVVGETIIAIGNPLGQLGGSVTSGIISALDRNITVEGKTMQLMQIDASINPGNSGGALFDDHGTLVGIVNAKSTGDDVEGIGFAIPIDNVIPILSDLQEYGYVKGKVSLGITMVDITSDQLAWMYRVNTLGVYIYSVLDNSTAAKAGLKSGDRIVSIDGTTISSSADVQKIVQSHKVGDILTFVIVRSGSQKTVSVSVGEYIPSGILNNQTLQ